jgi:molecular chaperone HtpG
MEKNSVAVTNSKMSSYIPNEIALSILSKLSVKSLKRFECVKKSWSLLFESHHFMNMFRINLFSNSHRCSYYDGASLFLRVFGQYQYDLYSLSGKKFENKVKLDCSNRFANHFNFRIYGFGSINGILCLYENNYYGKIVFWNPTTQEIKLIPPSLVDSVESFIPYVAKDFVSLDAMYFFHGFGYDDRTNDYMVIRYVYILGEHPDYGDIFIEELEDESLYHFWEIYNLRSNSWKKLDVNMPSSLDYTEGTQVYMDGVCHWFCVEDSSDGQCVVSFYLTNMVFSITPLPSNDDYFVFDETSLINLVVLNGSIALISYHEDTTFHISILGEFGVEASWTKLLTVGPLPCVERPIGVGSKGEIFFVRKDKELVWLDLSTQMIVELGFKGVGCSSRITMYKECILPIGGISN